MHDKVKAALAAMRADCGPRHIPKLLAVAEAALAASMVDDAYYAAIEAEDLQNDDMRSSRFIAAEQAWIAAKAALAAALRALGEP